MFVQPFLPPSLWERSSVQPSPVSIFLRQSSRRRSQVQLNPPFSGISPSSAMSLSSDS